jgi:DNA-binding beta-propeller fold protein YncE
VDAAGLNFGKGRFDAASLYISHKQGISRVQVGQITGPWTDSSQGQSLPPQEPAHRVESFITPGAGEVVLGIAFNRQADMFLAYNDSSIRRVLSKRKIVKYAATRAGLMSSGGGFLQRGMAFDALNNLYLTDGRRILMINPQGKTSTVHSGFSDAIDLKVDPQGNLLVADAMEGRVYTIDPAGKRSVLIDRNHGVRMQETLSGIAFDATFKNLYLADRLTGQILRYPMRAHGTVGEPELMADAIVALRSIAVDNTGAILASIDFPVIIRIDRNKQQRWYYITGSQDPVIGRIAVGQSPLDQDSLYVPTYTGILRLTLTEDQGN